MPERHPPAYLSASRLSSYAWCPAQFHRSYILGIKDPPSGEMAFGSAVHEGIEANLNGQDGELVFLRSWRTALTQLPDTQRPLFQGLSTRGLDLLSMVAGLDLQGESEKRIGVIHPEIPLPFIGYVDLWTEGHIYDFKTTRSGWSQKKADAQVFQPAIYSQAHIDTFGTIPRFTYVVLPRIAGPLQLVDGSRTGAQIFDAFERTREILARIEAGLFDCTCGRCEEPAA